MRGEVALMRPWEGRTLGDLWRFCNVCQKTTNHGRNDTCKEH